MIEQKPNLAISKEGGCRDILKHEQYYKIHL